MSYFPEILNDNLRFFINKISDSKKELEIRLVSDVPSQYETGQFELNTTINNPNAPLGFKQIYSELDTILKDITSSTSLDVVVPAGRGVYIPVVNANYTEDETLPLTDANRYFFVIKLNEKLPSEFKKLSTINLLILNTEITRNELFYGGKAPEKIIKFGNPLSPDFTRSSLNKEYNVSDRYESKNEITGSVPKFRLDYLLSGSAYDERLVDYTNFENFVFFSSAEKRIENFKTKLQTIETHINNISQSLTANGQTITSISAPATSLRESNFSAINDIVNNFTDYEKWLYFDSQQTSSGSLPGLGIQYTDSSASISTSEFVDQKFNYDGFDVAYIVSGSSQETINIINNKYVLDSYEFGNTTGSAYLSFLLKSSGSISDNIRHQNTLTSSIPHYPMDAIELETLAKPQATGSEYKRYIFKASGSHWIPTNENTVVGINQLDLGKGSSEVKVIKENLFTSSIQAAGEYNNFTTYITASGETFSGSFLPRGDLFNLSINPTGDTQLLGTIVDVKVTSENPTNIKPFSYHHPTTSTTFTKWYDGMISSASFYDSQNIQRISNNLPSNYGNAPTLNAELIKYVDTIGEFYDEYKVLVDDYYRLFNFGYSDYKQVPTKYNKLLAEHLGFNILPIGENNFLDLFGLSDNLNDSKKYSDIVVNNVLNNISYLYKTKGTENSIKALLNCYGLPSNVLKIKEGGVNRINFEQDILSNDIGLSGIGIFESTGSIQYESSTDTINSLIISEKFDNDEFKFPWNSDSTITQSCIEAIFKMPKTSNTMSLFSSQDNSDSRELWNLELYPSSSKRIDAKFRLRISSQANGSTSSDILTNSAFIDTDFVDVLDNNFINIAVQKSSSGHDTSQIHTYELLIGKSTRDKINFITSSKLVVDGDSDSTTNQNFISGSKTRHLFICNDFTGSIAQIKSWNEPLKISTFKQHIYNKKSIVGNNRTGSTSELEYYYPLQENYKSGSGNFTLLDKSIRGLGGPVNLDINLFESSSVRYDETIVDNFNFPVFGSGAGTIQYTDNMVSIEEPQKLKGNLSPFNLQEKISDETAVHTRELYFSRSPQDIINDFLKDNLGNIDFNDLFADPRDEYKSTYSDLDKFNNELLKYNIGVNLTQFINATNKIFSNSFIESVKKLLPAKAVFNVGNTLKPTYTQRIKTPILRENPTTELVSEPAVTIHKIDAPDLNGDIFTPPAANFYGFQNARTSSLGDFELEEYSAFTNQDSDVNLDDNFRDKVLTNPQKLWGTSSNDLHFKGQTPGINNDYNTYHYEENCVFIGISDVELLNNTTSSKSGKYFTNPQHYTASKSFLNRKNIQTSQAVPKRFLGRTQQFVATSSNEFKYGSVLDSDTRIPTNHISYLQQANWLGTNGKGSKLQPINFSNTSIAPGDTLWNEGNPYGDMQTDSTNNIARNWNDLSTSSFYRISTEVNQNTLRIVKDEFLDDDKNVG